MFRNLKKQVWLVLGAGLVLAQAQAATFNGFDGVFTPSNWQSGSNAPVNLVNTSNAPTSVTLSNYAPWLGSGATFRILNAPYPGNFSFNWTTSGTTPRCPAAYELNNHPTLLAASGSSGPLHVQAGQEFGFALNGADLPSNFGCLSNGSQISYTVSNFTFEPDATSNFNTPFAAANWQAGSNAPVNLVDTSAMPNSVTLSNYAQWMVSGATYRIAAAPYAGTLRFTYSTNGTTSACPFVVEVGNQASVLANGTQTVAYNIAAGEEFGFALNGQDQPGNFGCVGDGNQISVTISNFSYTPSN